MQSAGGSWTEPSIGPSCPGSTLAVWVGLGGTNGEALIQDGTFPLWPNASPDEAWWWIVNPNGNGTYSNGFPPITVSPGQSFKTTVSYQNGQATFGFFNDTTGAATSIPVPYTSPTGLSTADFVAEAAGDGSPTPLANFGNLDWGLADWSTASTSGFLNNNAGDSYLFVMADSNGALASPSNAPSWIGGFTDEYKQCQ
ncbi:MAG: G1 family glutamic endopeptidase [Solirubrobacteraceae bacterium]